MASSMRILGAASFFIAALGGPPPAVAQHREPPAFLGEAFLPHGLVIGGTVVEGLSGLTRIGDTDRYFAVCDAVDASPARYYELAIDLADGRLDDGDVSVLSVRHVVDAAGPLTPGSFDLEGVALDRGGQSLIVASEGAGEGAGWRDPFVMRNSLDGRYTADFDIDLRKLSRSKPGYGVYASGGVESLVYSADFETLWIAPETALMQDGPRASPAQGARARIMKFDMSQPSTPELAAEYVYPVSKKNGSIVNPGYFGDRSDRGLSDLLPVDDRFLLALEREWIAGEARAETRPVMLYLIDTLGADNVMDVERLRGDETTVSKTLVVDFDALRRAGVVERIGSFEAMAWGPPLKDGRRTLILLEDNDSQVDTQVLALAVRLPGDEHGAVTLTDPSED